MPKKSNKEYGHYPRERGASPPRGENRNRLDPAPRLGGRIDTISGGCAGGGDSRNSRKNYARREVYSSSSAPICIETISFSYAELQVLELPHDDLVVIGPVIANYTVEMMLANTGSSSIFCTYLPMTN
ncbi:hypothetical protein LIER_31678 [Lithospermum erythrorhizon]|uniref:Uncharacterized protein n=1 Tax=Lithospermum erythrorhizon TaxID=34254 RepID=A0AAV3RU37_LITER